MLKNRFLFHCLFAVLGIAAISCNKEPDLIGLDLLPPGERLNMDYTDTSTLVAYTLKEDSLRTDELSVNLLGSISDPVFGTTTASIYTQYRLSKNNVTFGENAVADSMILTLTYTGVYGDSLASKTIRIYEMDESIDYDTSYYSDRKIRILRSVIGEATFVPNLKEADSVDGNVMPPHMRIVLSQSFADKMISAEDSIFADNESFRDAFKGLYITSEDATASGTGSILYLNLLDAFSRLKLYYHNNTDTTSLDFPIGSLSARFNHFEHNEYTGADPALLQQFNGDTLPGNQRVFVQAMAGAKVKLRIPYLKALAANKRIAVNEAILIISVDDTSGIYEVPGQLALKKITESGTLTSLPDEDEGTSFLDGKSRSGKEYRFRVTRYVQNRLLNPEEPDFGLMMFAYGSSLSSNRVTLIGPGATDRKMRLLLYYTLVD